MSEFVALREPAAAVVAKLASAMAAVTQRPDGEKMALLMLRRSNDLAKAAVVMGTNAGWPAPRKQDWRSLIACKLIERDARSGFLVLTALGLMWQERIAVAMAKVAGEHVLLPATDSRFEISVRCTCGWSAAIDKRHSQNKITDQWRYFGQHMDAVAKGVWKQPRTAEQVLDDVMAKRAGLVPAQAGEEKVDA